MAVQDSPSDQDKSDLKTRISGGLLKAALGGVFRLIPLLGRLGPLGILLALLLMIGAVSAFGLLLMLMMLLWKQFQVTPAGQLLSLVLTIGGALLAVYFWIGRQARSVWGDLRLILLALGLAALVWWVWNSGFFHEARLNYMRARFEENPVYYVGRVYVLIATIVTAIFGAVLATQRFVRNAYRSPLHFIAAVARLTLMALVVIVLAWLALSSGQLQNFRSQLADAINPPWLYQEYGSSAGGT